MCKDMYNVHDICNITSTCYRYYIKYFEYITIIYRDLVHNNLVSLQPKLFIGLRNLKRF